MKRHTKYGLGGIVADDIAQRTSIDDEELNSLLAQLDQKRGIAGEEMAYSWLMQRYRDRLSAIQREQQLYEVTREQGRRRCFYCHAPLYTKDGLCMHCGGPRHE